MRVHVYYGEENHRSRLAEIMSCHPKILVNTYRQPESEYGLARDKNGKQIDTLNQNPILNTQMYEVMFPNGSVSKYAANIIAENIFIPHSDEDGHRLYQKIDCILGHRKTAAAMPMSRDHIYGI